jgi:DNA-binding protein H-NS
MATLEKVQAQISKLQARAEALVAKQSGAVLATISELMEKHNLTIADIDAHTGGKKRGPKPGAKAAPVKQASAPRYRDPKSGATWSGHGRAPAWIASAKDRSKFLIDGDVAAPTTAGRAKKGKAGNYVRGVQPALYVDPKTGATWSGRGRAPAWIADAKDRSRFLIAGPTEDKTGPKTTVVKKAAVAAKKAVAKKVATKTAISEKSIGERISAAMKKAPANKVAAKKPAAKKVVIKKVVASAAPATPALEPAPETGGKTSA